MKKIIFAALAIAMILVLSGCRDEKKKSSGFKKFEDLNVPGNKFEAYEGQDIEEKIPGIYACNQKYLCSEDEQKEFSKYNMYFLLDSENHFVYRAQDQQVEAWEKKYNKKFDWSDKNLWEFCECAWLTEDKNVIMFMDVTGRKVIFGRYGTVNGKEAVPHVEGVGYINEYDYICEKDENLKLHQFFTKIE